MVREQKPHLTRNGYFRRVPHPEKGAARTGVCPAGLQVHTSGPTLAVCHKLRRTRPSPADLGSRVVLLILGLAHKLVQPAEQRLRAACEIHRILILPISLYHLLDAMVHAGHRLPVIHSARGRGHNIDASGLQAILNRTAPRSSPCPWARDGEAPQAPKLASAEEMLAAVAALGVIRLTAAAFRRQCDGN